MNFWFWAWLLSNHPDTRVSARGCATAIAVFACILLVLWLCLRTMHNFDSTTCAQGGTYQNELYNRIAGCP